MEKHPITGNTVLVCGEEWTERILDSTGATFWQHVRSDGQYDNVLLGTDDEGVPLKVKPALEAYLGVNWRKDRMAEKPKEMKELGDLVADALSSVGITKERVSSWLGRPCGCAERQKKLNALHRWAKRTLKGVTPEEDHQQQFEKMVKKDNPRNRELPTMVVVAGCNRSGTSCVAGMLHKLGVPMGSKFTRTRWQNPTGFYEDAKLTKYVTKKPKLNKTSKQIVQWFRHWSEIRREAPVVGCKHPRLCNMLPEMAKVWPKLKVISISRSLEDVLASLRRSRWAGKNGRRQEMEQLLRNRDETVARLKLPSLTLEYDGMINDPVAAVDAMIDFLGIQPTKEQRQAAIDHVDPDLRHFKSPAPETATTRLVDVVYPLSNGSKWDNNEIRYSLRSLEKYATNLGRVFVVADKLPPWMKDVVHVPCSDVKGRNKDANIIDKIRAAIKAGVSERFVFASDDQYLVAPADLASMPVTHADWKTGKSKWWRRFNKTQEYLHSAGKPTKFYESHLFQPHSATQFEKAVADCDYSTNPGFTVNTIAFNQYDPVPRSVPRKELSGSVMRNYGEKVPKNHQDRMVDMFPARSKYEAKPVIKTTIARPRVFTFWTGPKPEIISLCQETMLRNIPDIEIWTIEQWRDLYDGSLGPWEKIEHRRPNVQSDILRYWLLKTYGGIWLDADYIAFRDIREVWDDTADYIGYMDRPERQMPYTALMGGYPNSPIMEKQCEFAREILNRGRIGRAAGPRLTHRAFRACPDAVKKIIPPKLIHPIRWKGALQNQHVRFNFDPDAYGLMLVGRVCRAFGAQSREEIQDHYSAVGQAFRMALDARPTYWMPQTTIDDYTPKSGAAEWCLTYECSLGCSNCARLGYLAKDIPPMTLDDAREFVSQCHALGWKPRRISITGGEPTLHPDFLELCQIAQDAFPGRVDVWSHQYGDKAKQLVAECKSRGLANIVESTAKPNGPIRQPFKDTLISPCDQGKTREPCKFHTRSALHCGISVDHFGYTVCPNGGVYAKVLGLDIHTKQLADVFDPEFAERQTKKLCRNCGMLNYSDSNYRLKNIPGGCQRIHGAMMSPTWKDAVNRLANKGIKTNGN